MSLVDAPIAVPAPPSTPVMSLAEADARLTAPGARFEVATELIRGVETKVWKNAVATLADLFTTSLAFGERTFLVYESERVDYTAFGRATRRLASAFASRAGKGDRIAILLPNTPEWVVGYFAAVVIGAVPVLLNPTAPADEIAFMLGDCGAKLALLDGPRLSQLGDVISDSQVEHTFVSRAGAERSRLDTTWLDDLLGGANGWRDLAEAAAPARLDIGLEDDATILYTSGTSGRPRGVLLSHRNLISQVFQASLIQLRCALVAGLPGPNPDPLVGPQRVNLVVVPLFHVSGVAGCIMPLMARGGKAVFMRHWIASRALKLIQDERVTVTGGVPVVATQLLEHPARAHYDLSSLEQVIYGGAPSPAVLAQGLAARLGVQAGNAWGMTETAGGFISHVGPEYLRRPSSCGVLSPVVEAKVADDRGRARPPGEVGELWVKGPQVMTGYWNNPAATAETLVAGWLKTGDLACIDAEGYCHIVDRAKDMLIRGGENIFSVEVENALLEHPAVTEAAVVGIPHALFGEEPGAAVSLAAGQAATEAELRAYAAARLAPIKVPVRVIVRSEPLPRNAGGKILKGVVKTWFA